MSEVVLASCSGGILNLTILEDLRADKVTGDGDKLADVALFENLEGTRLTRAEYERDFEAAYAHGRLLWTDYGPELAAGMEVSRLRERLLIPFFRLLGYAPTFQRAHLQAGDGSFRITHLGWDGTDTPPMILDIAAPDDRTAGHWSAHDELQAYLNASREHTWGVFSDGKVLRLLRDFHHTRTRGYVEFELEHIFEAGSLEDFRALWRLAHASRFRARPDLQPEESKVENPQDACLLEFAHRRSVSAGVAMGRRLQPQVRRAIERLANGALAANLDLRRRVSEEPTFGRELYSEVLTVLYRVLFLLFSEQREMLNGNRLYEDTYSITRLRSIAETQRAEGRRCDLWEGLKATFSAFHDEQRATALGDPPLTTARCSSRRVPQLVERVAP